GVADPPTRIRIPDADRPFPAVLVHDAGAATARLALDVHADVGGAAAAVGMAAGLARRTATLGREFAFEAGWAGPGGRGIGAAADLELGQADRVSRAVQIGVASLDADAAGSVLTTISLRWIAAFRVRGAGPADRAVAEALDAA